MKKIFIPFIVCFLIAQHSLSQIDSTTVDSLLSEYVVIYDSMGIWRFKDGMLEEGQLFEEFKSCFLQADHDHSDLVEIRRWDDHISNTTVIVYQQEFYGFRVEAAIMKEQITSTGFVHRVTGNLAYLDSTRILAEHDDYMSVEEAWSILESHLTSETEVDTFAWESSRWENEIKTDLNDQEATYHPLEHSEALWALTDFGPYPHIIPDESYAYAWKFHVVSSTPRGHRLYYIDAITGEIFRNESASARSGTLTTTDNGTQDFHIKYRGLPYNDFVLDAWANGYNFTTKDYDGNALWSLMGQVDNGSSNWGTTHQKKTMPHWAIGEAWDFWANSNTYDINGVDGDGLKLRVYANAPSALDLDDNPLETEYQYANNQFGNYDNVVVYHRDNEEYGMSLDIMAHEYTHGIMKYFTDLQLQGESWAVQEFICDVYGVLIEAEVEGSVGNWTWGEDATSGTDYLRSLVDPKSAYFHYSTDLGCDAGGTGQPDTYKGSYWSYGDCLHTGHVNAGVGNHWFYLLVNGGTGVNDHGWAYDVQGIDIEDAEKILWHVAEYTGSGGYEDALSNARDYCIDTWGECSPQSIQCVRAWHAVGVGNLFDCTEYEFPVGESENSPIPTQMSLWPNPASNLINMLLNNPNPHQLEIYDVQGGRVVSSYVTGGKSSIEVSRLPMGVYTVVVSDRNNRCVEKVVIAR